MPPDNEEPYINTGMSVERINHAALVVRDVNASVKWYKTWLGFDLLGSGQNASPQYIGNDKTKLALLQADSSVDFTFPANQGAQGCHVAFRTDSETFKEYERRLAQADVEYEELVHSDAHSLYFSDPDGYVLEVITYELG